MASIEIPDGWPELGELNGKPIKLDSETLSALPRLHLANVVVDVPGKGLIRPWRFLGTADNDGVRWLK